MCLKGLSSLCIWNVNKTKRRKWRRGRNVFVSKFYSGPRSTEHKCHKASGFWMSPWDGSGEEIDWLLSEKYSQTGGILVCGHECMPLQPHGQKGSTWSLPVRSRLVFIYMLFIFPSDTVCQISPQDSLKKILPTSLTHKQWKHVFFLLYDWQSKNQQVTCNILFAALMLSFHQLFLGNPSPPLPPPSL